MLTKAEELNIFDDDHFIVIFSSENSAIDQFYRICGVAGGQFIEGSGYPIGGLQQAQSLSGQSWILLAADLGVNMITWKYGFQALIWF